MTARATITQAQIARAIRAARAVDPDAVVEVVIGGAVVRVLRDTAVDLKPAAGQHEGPQQPEPWGDDD